MDDQDTLLSDFKSDEDDVDDEGKAILVYLLYDQYYPTSLRHTPKNY